MLASNYFLARCKRIPVSASYILRNQFQRSFATKQPKKSLNILITDLVTQVATVAQANKALDVLYAHPEVHWACDTEVADIDLSSVGPVGNGKVTCISIYGGPDIDFGDGPGSVLWIENIGASEKLLLHFKSWFEDPKYKKTWHNYGFDRHVMYNENIDCKGFGGDTMHMARLWDTSRDKVTGRGSGYSLESLSADLIDDERFTKISMKELFGEGKLLRDGSESKVKVLPAIQDLQLNPKHREKWITYSAKDAIATWWLRHILTEKLKAMDWIIENRRRGNMYDFYMRYLTDFGELLTDIERVGIRVDTKGHLKIAEQKAREEKAKMEEMFMKWISKRIKNAQYINTSSSAQMQMTKSDEDYEKEKESFLAANQYANMKVAELKQICVERGLSRSGKKADLLERLRQHDNESTTAEPDERDVVKNSCDSAAQESAQSQTSEEFDGLEMDDLVDICNGRGIDSSGSRDDLIDRLRSDSSRQTSMSASRPKRIREVEFNSLGLQPIEYTPKGAPKASRGVLLKLAGSNVFGEPNEAVWGTAYHAFGGGEAGMEACRALGALAAIGQIDTTIANFLVPLQALVDEQSRVHCSLNLNTETGRLSARRPNLQNQPALEKDQYRIRDAFTAAEGCTLIVADYGQLELRILAHLTNCKSMIEAFQSGGCFHSRTAVGMYPHIQQAIKEGKVLLEWDYSKGTPPCPLVKEVYGSERRKAKTLNFSIAYGKTVHGLAQDWGISTREAEETLAAWYRDRPEVKAWQAKTKDMARRTKAVRTIMGRYRVLNDAGGRGPAAGHALRAAINTPVQGSAADIVMMAMIKLWRSEVLKKLGWKLILQIHDEVILEGPKESCKEAMAEVVQCMEQPHDNYGLFPLRVSLDVDAKSADTWYKAK